MQIPKTPDEFTKDTDRKQKLVSARMRAFQKMSLAVSMFFGSRFHKSLASY